LIFTVCTAGEPAEESGDEPLVAEEVVPLVVVEV
jgi:hypothetical protein